MQPSSLIFVLVVAIWAVYLLQYWIKRRDHLSTVRSVDRFSAAMRVLDDHRMVRRVAEPTPRSYAVAPTRAARPQVTVKHAEAPRRAVAERTPGVPRRLRGLTLLVTAAMLPVLALLSALGPLPWWVAAGWLVGTVGAFVWLRQAVVAERAARARARVQQRPVVRTQRPAPARVAAPAARVASSARVAPEAPVAPVAPRAEVPASRSTRVYDVAQEQPVEVEPAAVSTEHTPVAEPAPGTWEPTPVPRPMYTMKAKAHRPEPAPLGSEQGPLESAQAPVAADVPQVIEVEDEGLPAIAGWA